MTVATYAEQFTGTSHDDFIAWAREHGDLRIALCGHRGDYDMPGWSVHDWSRGRLTYGGDATTEAECIWYSPGCVPERIEQPSLFDTLGVAS